MGVVFCEMLLHILLYKLRVAVKFASMLQASGPGKNTGDGVGAGRPSLRIQKEK